MSSPTSGEHTPHNGKHYVEMYGLQLSEPVDVRKVMAEAYDAGRISGAKGALTAIYTGTGVHQAVQMVEGYIADIEAGRR